MDFKDVWMTQNASLLYRVVPKCACSSIGQIMYLSDNGVTYEGDIHDSEEGLHKWSQPESREAMLAAIQSQKPLSFTCVRNPYGRILSAFFDKIAGIQRNGKRYRANFVPQLMQRYGIEVGSPEEGFDFDQIKSFRRFLLYARDTIRFRRPADADIHWEAMSPKLSGFLVNGGYFDQIFHVENFNAGMQKVLDSASPAIPIDVASFPRYNESSNHGPKRAHPISAYFDDLSHHLIWEIYKQDFQLYKYDFDDPDRQKPLSEVDLQEVNARLLV